MQHLLLSPFIRLNQLFLFLYISIISSSLPDTKKLSRKSAYNADFNNNLEMCELVEHEDPERAKRNMFI